MSNTTEFIPGQATSQAERLQQALMRVAKKLIASADNASPIFDLPVSHVKCLRVIAEKDDQKLREVAATLRLSLPSVSRIVDRLVKAGLVERQIDPIDRRALRLTTTAASRRLLEELRHAREARIEACIAHFTPEVAAQITESLNLLADAAEQAHTGF